jgi:hypothetical protein
MLKNSTGARRANADAVGGCLALGNDAGCSIAGVTDPALLSVRAGRVGFAFVANATNTRLPASETHLAALEHFDFSGLQHKAPGRYHAPRGGAQQRSIQPTPVRTVSTGYAPRGPGVLVAGIDAGASTTPPAPWARAWDSDECMCVPDCSVTWGARGRPPRERNLACTGPQLGARVVANSRDLLRGSAHSFKVLTRYQPRL